MIHLLLKNIVIISIMILCILMYIIRLKKYQHSIKPGYIIIIYLYNFYLNYFHQFVHMCTYALYAFTIKSYTYLGVCAVVLPQTIS